jgi:hypothetical protein
VGQSETSAAQYYLEGQSEIDDFLAILASR